MPSTKLGKQWKAAALKAVDIRRKQAIFTEGARRGMKKAGGTLWVSPASSPRQSDDPLQLRAYHMRDLEGHKNPILKIAQNLNFIVSVSVDEMCIFWKQRWRMVHRIEGPRVYQLCMTDKVLITRDALMRICLWNPARGKFICSHQVPSAMAPLSISEKNMLVAGKCPDHGFTIKYKLPTAVGTHMCFLQ